MLYEVGLILILVSAAFCGGSALVPVTVAAVGTALMFVGRRRHNGNNTNAER